MLGAEPLDRRIAGSPEEIPAQNDESALLAGDFLKPARHVHAVACRGDVLVRLCSEAGDHHGPVMRADADADTAPVRIGKAGQPVADAPGQGKGS